MHVSLMFYFKFTCNIQIYTLICKYFLWACANNFMRIQTELKTEYFELE